MVPSEFPIQLTYSLCSRLLSVSSRWFSGMRVWPGGMAGSGWLCLRASASCRHRSLRSNKLWMHRLRVDDSRADVGSHLPQVPLTLGVRQWDLLVGHVALLCGIVVLLGLLLLLQHLCQDLQRAGVPPGGPLGSAGIVANEVHTQALPLQDMAA